MQDFIMENWRYFAIGGCVLAYFLFDRVKSFLSKALSLFKGKKISSPTNGSEAEDIEALLYLRDRAISFGVKTEEIKSVYLEFFELNAKKQEGNK